MGQGLDSDPEWGSAETAWWDPGVAARVRDREEMARARGLEAVSRSLLCVLRVLLRQITAAYSRFPLGYRVASCS